MNIVNKTIIAAITSILLSACSSTKIIHTDSTVPTSASVSTSTIIEKEQKKAKREAIKRLTALSIKTLDVRCERRGHVSSRIKKTVCTTKEQREIARLYMQETLTIIILGTPL